MKHQFGQSLIEVLIAMAVFVIGSATVSFLIIDAYVSDQVGLDRGKATFLAQEGLEQARLTRNANWNNLVSVVPQTIGKFIRTVAVENIDSNRKKVTSKITWQAIAARPQELSMITYLTNWKAPTTIPNCNTACINLGFRRGNCTTIRACRGTIIGGLRDYRCQKNRVCCCN